MNEDFNRDSIVNSTADDLALRCLAHLEQEDAMLQASWELVQQTRKALLERDQQRLHELLERQQPTAVAAQKLHSARQMIRRDIAACFSIPAEMLRSVIWPSVRPPNDETSCCPTGVNCRSWLKRSTYSTEVTWPWLDK